jgi:uncharacterized protein YjbJ (UPF0337 family)
MIADPIADGRDNFRTKVKEKWDKITDDDLTAIAGKRTQLADLLQVRYGFDQARAKKELDELERKVRC